MSTIATETPALTSTGAQLRFFTSPEPLGEETQELVTINDKHVVAFFRTGSRGYDFSIETFPSPDMLAAALKYRYEATETTRAEVEASVARMKGTSVHTFERDLALAFADLTVRGFTS